MSCFFGSLHADTIKERADGAQELYDNGRYDDAITVALGVIESAPDNYRANWVCAVSYLNLEFYSEAIRYYKRVLEISKDVSSYSNMGGAYAQLGGDEIPMAYFDTALSIKPDYTTAIANRAAVHANWGRIEKVIEVSGEVLAIDPQDLIVNANLATLYFVNKNYEEANNWLKIAIDVAPDPARYYQFQEELNEKLIKGYKFSKPRLLQALAYYDKKFQKNRYETFNVLRRGECHDKLGERALAIKDFQLAISLLDDVIADMPMAWTKIKHRGEAYEYLGRKNEALRDYRRVLELNPTEKEVIEAIAKLTK